MTAANPWPGIGLLLVPPLAFAGALIVGALALGASWLLWPGSWPWELWMIFLSGSAATVAGLLDHRFHFGGGRWVGERERRSEHLGLLCGAACFALLLAASLAEERRYFVLPLIIALLTTTTLICYDEFLFHRKLSRYEARLHRLLVFGHALAMLAWVHWLYVRDGRLV